MSDKRITELDAIATVDPADLLPVVDMTDTTTKKATAAQVNESDPNRPSDGQKAALAGTSGTPGAGNKYVTNDDSRNTDDRDPTAHETTHRSAGSDPLSVLNLAGFPGGMDGFLRKDATFNVVGSKGLADAAVNYTKIQDISAASRVLGRGSAAGAGVVEEISLGAGLTMTGTSLDTTVSAAPVDAQYIVAAANGTLTAERVATDTATVTWDFSTAAQAKANVPSNAVTNAILRDSGALSVIGRSANTTGDPADISASAASDAVLRESGSVLGFGTIATAGIANKAVTFAKIQDVTPGGLGSFLGKVSGVGSIELMNISVPSLLHISGTSLIISDQTGPTVFGNFSAATQAPTFNTPGTDEVLLEKDGILAFTAPNELAVVWASVSFNANNFVGTGGATWTVASGDQTTFQYFKFGKFMVVQFAIDTSSLSSGPTSELNITIPGSFTCSKLNDSVGAFFFNGSTVSALRILVDASGTVLRLLGTFADSTDNLYVRGTVILSTTA